ncbi:glycosyltransferase family 2 protein [Psychrobacter okhotskensis]|uniref:glycosyltransferase family 2 protein n=1 Tax=Psychrobacter okhotskensis TaxID=212403 RepID=UPI003F57FEE0
MINCPKVSVIIPVFNGEQFLDRCLSSITNQSYKNIEIIVIDDGSTDDTKTICKNYSHNDHRIKAIHKDNEGVSAARNIGLDIATGDYIYFADADDYVLQDSIKDLMNKARDSFADIIVAEYYVANASKKTKVTPIATQSSNDFLCSILSGKNHSGLWNKLFKRNLFSGIRFPKNIVFLEDKVALTMIMLKYKPSVSFLDSAVYTYWQHQESVTNSSNEKVLDIFKANIYIANFLNENTNNYEIRSSFSNTAYESIYFVLRNVGIDYLDEAVVKSLDFQSELKTRGFLYPNTKKGKLVRALSNIPLPLAIFSVRKIRYLPQFYLKVRNNL